MRRLPLAFAGVLLLNSPASGQGPTPFDTAKARVLLEERLPCLGCHALGERGGRVAPDLATVRTRRTPAEIAAIIDDPARALPGAAMPRTPLPQVTRDLLIRFLAGATAAAPAAEPAPPSPPLRPDGPALYATWCQSCHGSGGRGDGPNAAHLPVPPAAHADAARLGRRSDDQLVDAIAMGGEARGRSPRMPGFGATLHPTEIRAVVRHLRALCQCSGPAWATGPDGAPPR